MKYNLIRDIDRYRQMRFRVFGVAGGLTVASTLLAPSCFAVQLGTLAQQDSDSYTAEAITVA